MTVIPIGIRCEGAAHLKSNGERKNAFPFDWIFCSLDVVQHCIETNFSYFLDVSLYKTFVHPEHGIRTHHLLYDDMNLSDTIILYHHIHADKGDTFCTFVHQNMLDVPTYDAFSRRAQRFMTTLDEASESSPVTLLYVMEHISPEEIEIYKTKLLDFRTFLKNRWSFVYLKVYWFTPPNSLSDFSF